MALQPKPIVWAEDKKRNWLDEGSLLQTMATMRTGQSFVVERHWRSVCEYWMTQFPGKMFLFGYNDQVEPFDWRVWRLK